MIYNGYELSNYPICDTDIWVDAILAKIDEKLIKKYQKIVVADVVEKEIRKFQKNPYFKIIAERFEEYKKNDEIIVICHSDIDEETRKFLEKQLVDCDSRFETGLADKPHEEHKGEIVSAIYAKHFECPFLKSNDGAFHDGDHVGGEGSIHGVDIVGDDGDDVARLPAVKVGYGKLGQSLEHVAAHGGDGAAGEKDHYDGEQIGKDRGG